MQARHFGIFILTFIAVAFGLPSDVLASTPTTIGGAIKNLQNETQNFTRILAIMSYIGGAYLAVKGTLMFRECVDNGGQALMPISGPIKRLGAGGALLALPFMMRAVYETLFGSASPGSLKVSMSSGLGARVADPASMDQMIVNFVADVAPAVSTMLTAFCYFCGIAILMLGISRLTKRAEDGPRGPGGAGTIMCFVTAGALIAMADSAGVFATSIFGDNQLKTKAQISATVIADGADREKIESVIQSLMIFIMMVGYIAFVRGWFVLKAFANGNQSATIAQGITFLIGGTLAINLGELINLLQGTLGLNAANSLGFI